MFVVARLSFACTTKNVCALRSCVMGSLSSFVATACRPSQEGRKDKCINKNLAGQQGSKKRVKSPPFLSADKEKGLLLCGESKSCSLYILRIPTIPFAFLLVIFSVLLFFQLCALLWQTRGEGSRMMMVVVSLLVINKQRLTTLFKVPSRPLFLSYHQVREGSINNTKR